MCLHHALNCHARGSSGVVGLTRDNVYQFAAASGALFAEIISRGNMVDSFKNGLHQLSINVGQEFWGYDEVVTGIRWECESRRLR
eukprot:2109551-Pleurochrysis_carterae.AAC.1